MASPVNYRALFEQTPDNYLLLAPDPPRFTMIAASETRLRETMTRREDLIGRPLFEVFPDNPDDPGATGVRNLAASLRRVIHSRKAERMPLQRYDIRAPDGEFVERYWEPSNVPVFDEGGELIYIIHRAEDVTERVRAEAALREIEERERLLAEEAERVRGEAERRAEKETALHDLAHALSAAVSVREVVQIVVDEAVELTRAFGAYVERLEVPEPGSEVEVIAISGAGVPPLGTRVPYPGSLTEEIIEAGKPEIMTEVGAIGESMAPYLARSCRLCSGLVVPLSSEQRPLGALVLLRGPEQDQFTEAEALFARALGDASSVALRRALLVEEIDRDRRERMALLESTGEGIYAIDNEGRVTILNRAGAEILGYAPEEVLGKRMHDLIHHSRPDGSPYPFEECPIIRTIRVGEGVRVDSEELWKKDGSSFPAEYSAYPIVEDDDVTGAVITFTDITERKRAEEAQRLLAEAGAVLAASLDYEGTLARVARLAVPALADYCIVDIIMRFAV